VLVELPEERFEARHEAGGRRWATVVGTHA
jgi:hypothetical protein